MKRRNFFQAIGAADCVNSGASRNQRSGTDAARRSRSTYSEIKDISVIECQPAGVRLTVVKIATDQDGLYGDGCAMFTHAPIWSSRRWKDI